MPPCVRRDDAVVVTPTAYGVRPAQTRVGETVQHHKGRAVGSPELVHAEQIGHGRSIARFRLG